MKLEEAICAIHNSSCISYSLEELYLAVENMCSHKMADKLYNRLTVKCENHIKQRLPKLLVYLLLTSNIIFNDRCSQVGMVSSKKCSAVLEQVSFVHQ